MSSAPAEPRGGRRGTMYAVAATAALVVVGGVLLVLGLRGSSGPFAPAVGAPLTATSSTAASPSSPPSPTTSTPTTTAPTTTAKPVTPPDFGQFFGASHPTRIDIDAIGVHATTFVDLHKAADGTITVPGSAAEVGLYAAGPSPGQVGASVVAAHVDSIHGPGVFYRLGSTKPGDTVRVSRADGKVLTFTVDKVASYPKDHFPTQEVYNGTGTRAEIRLVTCGGTFDRVKHYLDNVVVFGHLTSAT